MSLEAQKRVQDAVNNMLSDLDRTCLRKIEAEMFACSTKCCENTVSSTEQVARCVEDCSSRFRKSQSYISNELNEFQGRLERCALQCKDDIRDKMTADTTDDQMDHFQKQYESCVIKCADNTVKVLPDLFKRMKSIITKEAYHKV